jgi:hypothetical protein
VREEVPVGVEGAGSGLDERVERIGAFGEERGQLSAVELRVADVEGDVVVEEAEVRDHVLAEQRPRVLQQRRPEHHGEHLDLVLDRDLGVRRRAGDDVLVQLPVAARRLRPVLREQVVRIGRGPAGRRPAGAQPAKVGDHEQVVVGLGLGVLPQRHAERPDPGPAEPLARLAGTPDPPLHRLGHRHSRRVPVDEERLEVLTAHLARLDQAYRRMLGEPAARRFHTALVTLDVLHK